MTRYRATLEYDGTDFAGWQLQRAARTVQGELERALEKITGSPVRPTAAGRTDSGVHATGQVVHFDVETRLSPVELRRGTNAVLPPDVAIVDLYEASPDFHARKDAAGKRYVYRLLTRASPSPLRRRFAWHARGPLDLEAVGRASRPLLGLHDFRAFRGAAGGEPGPEDTRRRIDRLDWERDGDEIRVIAEGSGFLRYMVRNLVGTLVEVGCGRRSVDSVREALLSLDRSRAGPTAPAHGLCLARVFYRRDDEGAAAGPSGPS
jgi:tRNA pseudouridine38-40 synthase